MPTQLPQHIIDALKNGKTSLGDHPCFPPENEDKFVVSIMKKRFKELSEEVNGFTSEEIKKKLNRYITKVQKIEEPEKGALETICKGLIGEIFNIPQDTIDITPHLVNTIDTSKERLRPETIEDFEFDDIDSINRLTSSIYKRRMLNALVTGASAYYGNKVSLYEEYISSVNPDLALLYEKINLCNDYLLITEKDSLSTKDKKYTDAGSVEVYVSDMQTQPKIDSFGVTFPVMFVETIKGILEVACLHGLPEKQKDADFVIKKADFKLAENWDLRLGYPLWECIINCFKKINVNPLEIGLNFVFMEIASLPTDEFNSFLQEVFANTSKGKALLNEMVDNIQENFDRDDFDNYMTDKASEFHQLNDSVDEYQYFTTEELEDDDYLINESIIEKIKNAEQNVNVNPTDGQKKAGNYKMGHVTIDGLRFTIENPKGSYRKGKDKNGKSWSVKMNNTYGYIRGAKSVDGDEVDMYISDDPTTGNVYVIDQVNRDGTFDEHKVMYGFKSYDNAKENYLANFEDGWQGLGKITEVSKDDFKKWLNSSYRKRKPFSEYVKIEQLGTTKGRKQIKENVENFSKYELIDTLINEGDFYYWYESPFDRYGRHLHVANSEEIQEEIFDNIRQCGYIEVSHDLDNEYYLTDRCPEGFVAYKLCSIPQENDYYVIVTNNE